MTTLKWIWNFDIQIIFSALKELTMTQDSKLSGSLAKEISKGVGKLCFGHPAGNSLPGELLRQLATAIDELGNDKRCKAIYLYSQGERTFCAGASFDELLASTSAATAEHFFSGFALVIDALRRCPKLTLCKVQGKAVGGGVGILSACDYVIAHQSASIRLSELALGIGPFIIGPAVERKIGKAAFMECAIDTEWKDSSWALQKGLFNKVCPDHQILDQSCIAFLETLCSHSELATTRLKKVLWEGTEDWKALLFGRVKFTASLSLTPECRSRVEAFKKD
jgi:methylglutaconyl-CoA hydratase